MNDFTSPNLDNLIIIGVRHQPGELRASCRRTGRVKVTRPSTTAPLPPDAPKWLAVALAEDVALTTFRTHIISLLGTCPDEYSGAIQYVFRAEALS